MKIKPLEEVLAYRNEQTITRFLQTNTWFQGTREEAEKIFEELLRFLWLYATIEQQKKENPDGDFPDISISDSMAVIDLIWHDFILFTEMYCEFCEKYFGAYLHHPPAMEKYVRTRDIIGKEKAIEVFVTEMVSTVFETFGEAVAVRWFDEFFKYGPPEVEASIGHHH